MNSNEIVRAWKDASFRAALSDTQLAALPASPAGARLVEMDEEQLQNVSGGYGCGWMCTITTECGGNNWSRVLGCGSWP